MAGLENLASQCKYRNIKLQELIRRFGSSLFKCGESDSGRKLKATLREYIEYALYNRDDSPLYMFEACLEEHPEAKEMMDDYQPPKVLKEDLFTELVSNKLTNIFSSVKNEVHHTDGF